MMFGALQCSPALLTYGKEYLLVFFLILKAFAVPTVLWQSFQLLLPGVASWRSQVIWALSRVVACKVFYQLFTGLLSFASWCQLSSRVSFCIIAFFLICGTMSFSCWIPIQMWILLPLSVSCGLYLCHPLSLVLLDGWECVPDGACE